MKTKNIFCLSVVFFSLILVGSVHAQVYQNKYLIDRDNRNNAEWGVPSGYREVSEHSTQAALTGQSDPHVKVIGWDPKVPSKRVIQEIQEGVTDQIAILKLFSAPNIITRSPEDKETWVYHWLWSYKDEYSPNGPTLLMDRAGKRVRRNRHPVSMELTFNNKDIVESYSIKLIKKQKNKKSFGD